MTIPCKGCTDRHATCHADCERYAAFAAERERIRQKRDEENAVETAKRKAIEHTKKCTVWKK